MSTSFPAENPFASVVAAVPQTYQNYFNPLAKKAKVKVTTDEDKGTAAPDYKSLSIGSGEGISDIDDDSINEVFQMLGPQYQNIPSKVKEIVQNHHRFVEVSTSWQKQEEELQRLKLELRTTEFELQKTRLDLEDTRSELETTRSELETTRSELDETIASRDSAERTAKRNLEESIRFKNGLDWVLRFVDIVRIVDEEGDVRTKTLHAVRAKESLEKEEEEKLRTMVEEEEKEGLRKKGGDTMEYLESAG